jgi:hypothetical protein
MSSSLTTLSMSLRLSSSVIRTFHCGDQQCARREGGVHTSPRVVLRMVLRITASASAVHICLAVRRLRTLALYFNQRNSHAAGAAVAERGARE